MIKGNSWLFISLVVLLAVAGYFFMSRNTGTIPAELKNFAIKDTASIDKIFIADSDGNTVLLKRRTSHWTVNDKYTARPHSVNLLLKTFNRLSVKMPVSKNALEPVIKRMATNSTKVEVYQGKDVPSKVYYVGAPTADNQGTHMLLQLDGKKSSQPFIMHVPGFHGFLTSRFFTDELQWRNPLVFNAPFASIQKIKVHYYENAEASFQIERYMDEITLKDHEGKQVDYFNDTLMMDYLSRYDKVYYEAVNTELPDTYRDSILSSPPYFSISVEEITGKTNTLVAYHMPNFKKIQDKDGKEFPYDVSRMYGYLNDELFILIQFPTFNALTLPRSYFMQ